MRQRILAILAAGVAALLLFTLFRAKPSVAPLVITQVTATEVTRSVKKGAAAIKTAVEGTVAPLAAKVESQPAVSEPVEWGSDPFVRDWMLMSEVANLNLRAITVSSNGASALINDQILQIGDVISGKRVINIESDRVTLEQGGRTFTLTLGE
ncbi:MAG: hypothetical protein ACUVUR_02555 [bacterium]